MNIICIDTANQNIGITAKGKDAVFTSIYTSANKRMTGHASCVLPISEYVIKQAGFTVDETELILCPQGPGSFTGLRLAYAVAKALQLKSGAKFYAVPVLQAIAFKYEKQNEQILSIIDAKRDCFYAQVFENGKESSEPFDISAQEAIKMTNAEKKLSICGVGCEKFQNDILNLSPKFTNNDINYIEFDISELSKLILNYYEAGKTCIEVKEYDGPLYIRKSDAEK